MSYKLYDQVVMLLIHVLGCSSQIDQAVERAIELCGSFRLMKKMTFALPFTLSPKCRHFITNKKK